MSRFHLPLVLAIILPLSVLVNQSACAGEILETNSIGLQLSEFARPATTVKEWLAQTDRTDAVQVTKVQINRTETGLEIILETEGGRALQIDLYSPPMAIR